MAELNYTIPELTTSELQRFQSKIAPPNERGCELWTAGLFNDGYGQFGVWREKRQLNRRAHRIAYFLHYGVQPGELLVCHTCDVPLCTAKAHLFLGTPRENNQDAAKKDRTATGDRNGKRTHPELIQYGDDHHARRHPENLARGERNGNARLNPDKVRRILQLHGQLPSHKAGKMFGVSDVCVQNIWNGKTWKHVT